MFHTGGEGAAEDLYDKISPELLMAELDTCSIKIAGRDPADFIRRYGARCEVVHLKDFIREDGGVRFRPVGFGEQIWEPILSAAAEAANPIDDEGFFGLGQIGGVREEEEEDQPRGRSPVGYERAVPGWGATLPPVIVMHRMCLPRWAASWC